MADAKSNSKKHTLLFFASTVLPPPAAVITGLIAKDAEGLPRVALILLTAALAMLPPLWGFWLKRKARLEERLRQEALLAPIIDHMSESLTNPAKSIENVAKIQERLGALLSGNVGARCTFYAYDKEEEHFSLVDVWGGAKDVPATFEKNSDAYRKLKYAMDRKGDPIYTGDNQNPDANLNFALTGGHRSTIVSGSFAGDEIMGLLIIDAPSPGCLPRSKVPPTYVWVHASLFGFSRALALRAGPNSPEVPPQAGRVPSGDGSPSRG